MSQSAAPTPTPLAADPKVALDQYNKQLAYFRDISRNAVVIVLAFIGFHYSNLADRETRIPYSCSVVVPIIANLVILWTVWKLQTANRDRCRLSYENLVAVAGGADKLRPLGIIDAEYRHLFLRWMTIYLGIHGTFVGIMVVQLAQRAIAGSC